MLTSPCGEVDPSCLLLSKNMSYGSLSGDLDVCLLRTSNIIPYPCSYQCPFLFGFSVHASVDMDVNRVL